MKQSIHGVLAVPHELAGLLRLVCNRIRDYRPVCSAIRLTSSTVGLPVVSDPFAMFRLDHADHAMSERQFGSPCDLRESGLDVTSGNMKSILQLQIDGHFAAKTNRRILQRQAC
jgi:hypothetical protein